jgi:hypothetical protein
MRMRMLLLPTSIYICGRVSSALLFTSIYNFSCLKMSDSSTSESYTHATSVSSIFGLCPLQFPDHLPRHDPSQSSDQLPAISIPILNPSNRPSNLDHHTTSEFLDGPPGSPVSSDSGELLITLTLQFFDS